MRFDRIAMLDWSAAGSPATGKDSIWLAVTDATGTSATNHPTRVAAEKALNDLCDRSLHEAKSLLIGADFNFGAPRGFAARLTGETEALALWRWLSDRVKDGPANQTNYRAIAAEANAAFPGLGPFWGNGQKAETPGLPRTKPPLPAGLAEHRTCDARARYGKVRPKAIWQLAGAGAVGAQTLTGLPVLWRLRQRLAGQCHVWPMEPPTAPVVIVEIYAAHLDPLVRALESGGMVRDEAQMRLLAAGLHRLGAMGQLHTLFEPMADRDCLVEEGWTLGVHPATPDTFHAPMRRAAASAFGLPDGPVPGGALTKLW